MGQYYRPVVGRVDVKKLCDCKIFDSFNVYDSFGGEAFSGMKLTEHGWIGNWFVMGVEEQIYKNPCRVAWVGDYAETDMMEDAKKHSGASYIPRSKSIWARDKTDRIVHEKDFPHKGKFLVNHTTREYIDFDEYMKRCVDDDGWQLDPLPMLTAIGNGLGGGDYYNEDYGLDEIGSWAWHILSIEDTPPLCFNEFCPTFFDRTPKRLLARAE